MAGVGTRLQRQRPAAKGKHQRGGQRADRRGYPDDGKPWGGKDWASGAVPFPATAATQGIPGTWAPSGSTPPATLAALQGGTPNVVVANPTTAWLIGRYVQTATAGAPGEATWTGSGWVGGRSPGLASVLDGTIDEVKAYVGALGQDEWRDDIIQELLDHEREGQNRATLVSWLDQQTGVE
jgi:hypothetical protein